MATLAIVTPVYATEANRRLDLLAQTMRSVSSQQLPGDSYVQIVVDDGSEADVAACVKSHGDACMRYLRRERKAGDLKTASNAINFGLELVMRRSGDVFTQEERSDVAAATYLHSDDLFTRASARDRLSRLEGGAVYTDMALFDDNVRYVSTGDRYLRPRHPFYPSFNHHTIMWGMEFLHRMKEYAGERYGQDGIFDPKLFYGEDLDVSMISLEVADKHNLPMSYAREVTVMYRMHELSITGSNIPSEVERQKDHITSKHPQVHWSAPNRLLANPPWSFFTFLPEPMKRKLRPLQGAIIDALHLDETEAVRKRLSQELLSYQ
jgi:hypothetical protein